MMFDLQGIDCDELAHLVPMEKDNEVDTLMMLMAMAKLLKLGSIVVESSGVYRLSQKIGEWAIANGAALARA